MGFIEMINIILLDAQLYQDVSHGKKEDNIEIKT